VGWSVYVGEIWRVVWCVRQGNGIVVCDYEDVAKRWYEDDMKERWFVGNGIVWDSAVLVCFGMGRKYRNKGWIVMGEAECKEASQFACWVMMKVVL